MNPAYFAVRTPACTPTPASAHGPDRVETLSYDAGGQVLQRRVAVGTSVQSVEATYQYNDNGQVVAMVDANGNRAQMRFDGLGRQDRWIFPSPVRPASFDGSTQAAALASAGAANAADYEEYGYDPVGNRTSLRKRDGSTLAFSMTR
jgi:YD repeat-containing protein